MSWAHDYPTIWAVMMQDGRCGYCEYPDPPPPGRFARVHFLAGELAVWESACGEHRTRLELAA